MAYTTYSIRPNQSLLDIAVQVYGEATGVYALLADNPQLHSITARLHVGDTLRIRIPPTLSVVQQRAQIHGVHTLENAQAAGIGFWTIGRDFIISYPHA